MSDPIDILIPLGRGSHDHNQELRFALRSIERFAQNYKRVVVVGDDPRFLKEGPRCALYRCAEASGNKEFRIASKIGWAFLHADLTEDVAFWNDDFVLTKPVDVSAIPRFQKGPLQKSIAALPATTYRRSLEDTAKLLARGGWPTNHYDIHCPIIYNRASFLRLANWWKASRASYAGLVVKSIYANVIFPDDPGPTMVDCKLQGAEKTPSEIQSRISSRWVFSYNTDAFRSGLAGLLQTTFPEHSAFEDPL